MRDSTTATHSLHSIPIVLALDLNLFLFIGEYLYLRARFDYRLFTFFQKTEGTKQNHQRYSGACFVAAFFALRRSKLHLLIIYRHGGFNPDAQVAAAAK